MRALIIPTDSEIDTFLGTFEEAKEVCGWDTAKPVRINGHVMLMVDEEARMKKGQRVNGVATFIAKRVILGNAFLVLEN